MALTRTALLLGAALIFSGAEVAAAADLGSYGSMKDAPLPVYESSPASWYLRVDGGYSSFDEPTMTEADIFFLSNPNIDSTWSVGGGIGRYLGHGFRGDLTYDHRFTADAEGTLAAGPGALIGTRYFGVKSDVFLANLYYDFDMGGRFTPYIGVGLGFTRNKTTSGWVETCGCTTATIEEGSETHVAGAAMAGVSMRLRGGDHVVQGGGLKDAPVTVSSRGLYLDVGYRFLYLGSVETGAIVQTGAPGGTIVDDPTVDDLHAHEFRFGLRYEIN